MSKRPVSLGSKAFCRDALLLQEHAAAMSAGRPTLYSVRNCTRLAAESSRARCPPAAAASQHARPRDFTAHFKASLTGDPSYAASHTSPEPLPIRCADVPTYPVTQSLRWHPYVETSSIEDVRHAERGSSFNCKCARCISKNCPSRVSSTTTLRSDSGSNRSNNITRFVDIYTMTPKLTDAACGSAVVPSPQARHDRAAEVSPPGSDVAVRDTRHTPCTDPPRCPPDTRPAPILKNTRRLCDYNDSYTHDSYCSVECEPPVRCHQPAERDVFDERCVSPRVSSIRSFFRGRRHRKERDDGACPSVVDIGNRKMLYNEGISDWVYSRYPAVPMDVPSDGGYSSAGGVRSKVALRYCDDDYPQIPHSHRHSVSRYHQNCRSSRSKVYVMEDNVCRVVPTSPRLPPRRASPACRPAEYYRPPCIRLPRKVLTSAVNIDSFVEGRRPRPAPACARRKG